jgi:curved DNA-binding protein CbpA
MYAKDYYRIMGTSPDASEGEIKAAYRKLAMQYHPDRNRKDPHSVERLKEINDAYHVLGNKERKEVKT